MDIAGIAEMRCHLDNNPQIGVTFSRLDEVLRPDAEDYRTARREVGRNRNGKAYLTFCGQGHGDPLRTAVHHLGSQEVHLGRPHETCDELIGGVVIKVERRSHLLDAPCPQHDDFVGKRHGFGLIMCHVDHGRAKPAFS